MSWKPDARLANLILDRVALNLKSDSPEETLKALTVEMSKSWPDINIDTDYSILEDLAIQKIILEHNDHVLDELWYQYNQGYFQHCI